MGYRLKKTILYPFIFCLFCLLLFGYIVRIQVLEIGEGGKPIRIRNRDIVTLQYTHSMYGVTVKERLIVDEGRLILYHVDTNDAALEYFGIEGKEKYNVRVDIKGIGIPKDSIGNHILYLRDKALKISQYNDLQGIIHIRLRKIPLIVFLISYIWR